MLEKLYKKSEVWFAVIFIVAYVVGDSFLIQASLLLLYEISPVVIFLVLVVVILV